MKKIKIYKTIKDFYLKNRFFLIFLILWIIFFSGIRTLQHYSFRTNACDLSIFDYGMYYTLRGEIMCEPFHGYWGTHFAIHFTPIIFLIVPFYLIFNGPLFLLYLQILAVGLSAIPLYLIAKNEFKKKHIPVIITVIYLLFRHVLTGLMYDFHTEMLFPLFLFLSYYFIAINKKPTLYFLFITLALFIKEDIAIYIFFYGVFLFFRIKDNRKIGLITAFYSIFYFLFTTSIILPYFRDKIGLKGELVYLHLWQNLGNSPLEIIKNLIASPQVIFQSVSWAELIPKFSNLVSSLLLIPFFSSFVILIFPPVFVLITSKDSLMHGFGLYYSVTLIPFLFLALIYGLRNIKNLLYKSELKKIRNIFAIIVTFLLIVNVANTKWNLLNISRYSLIKDYKSVKKSISLIPQDASVASLSSLIPHISKRRYMSILPEIDNASYILIHTKVNCWPMSKEEFINIKKQIEEKDYQLLKQNGDIYLFKRIKKIKTKNNRKHGREKG